MGVLLRAVAYSTLFISFFLVALPSWILGRVGVGVSTMPRALQVLGLLLGIAGVGIAVGCILTFVLRGKGTPAPFDPPRRLVVSGPYRYVRNPMYLGAGLALLGAAVFYGSPALALYFAGFLLLCHLLVRWYEEPILRQSFGTDYDAYCAETPRWLPRRALNR